VDDDTPEHAAPEHAVPRIERHQAYDRFGKSALRTAHDLSEALSEAGRAEGDEPVVLRTNGPHRSIDGLAALIDAALADGPPAAGTAGGKPAAGGPPEDRR
jgi:hypothetical protein